MGMDADAHLIYGVDLGDIETTLGFPVVDEFMSLRDAGQVDEITEFLARNFIDVDGMAFVTYQSYDYPKYIVGIKESSQTAWFGSAKIIAAPYDFHDAPAWDKRFKQVYDFWFSGEVKEYIKKYQPEFKVGWYMSSLLSW